MCALKPDQIDTINETVRVVIDAFQRARSPAIGTPADIPGALDSAELLRTATEQDADPSKWLGVQPRAKAIFAEWRLRDPRRLSLVVDSKSGRIGALVDDHNRPFPNILLDVDRIRPSGTIDRERVSTDPKGVPVVSYVLDRGDELKATIVGTDVTITAVRR